MASLAGMYDPDVDPQSFEIIPECEAVAQVIETDLVTTTAGDGKMIALTFEILEGPYKGRQVYSNLNVRNPSEKAQQIGNAQFAALRIALWGKSGKDKIVNDTLELQRIPLRIKIACEKRKDNGEMTNVIKRFSHLTEKPETATTEAMPAGEKKPW